MKGLNGTCIFAYEIKVMTQSLRRQQSSPKSLPDIQRSTLAGKILFYATMKSSIRCIVDSVYDVTYIN